MDINDWSIFSRQYQTPLGVILIIFTFVMVLLIAITAIKQMKKTVIAIFFFNSCKCRIVSDSFFSNIRKTI